MKIVEITKEDIERNKDLEEKDIGKWCFLINDCYQGFYDSYDEARAEVERIENETEDARLERLQFTQRYKRTRGKFTVTGM